MSRSSPSTSSRLTEKASITWYLEFRSSALSFPVDPSAAEFRRRRQLTPCRAADAGKK